MRQQPLPAFPLWLPLWLMLKVSRPSMGSFCKVFESLLGSCAFTGEQDKQLLLFFPSVLQLQDIGRAAAGQAPGAGHRTNGSVIGICSWY